MSILNITDLRNALATLLVNNTTGDIEAEPLRDEIYDVVDSTLNVHGIDAGDIPVYMGSGSATAQASGIQMIRMGAADQAILLPDNAMAENQGLMLADIARLNTIGSLVNVFNTGTEQLFEIVDHRAGRDEVSLAPSYFLYQVTETAATEINPNGPNVYDLSGGVSFDWTPDYTGRVWGMEFEVSAMALNVRIRVVDESGVAVLHWPSIAAWETETGGANWTATGRQRVELDDSPLFAAITRQHTIEIRAQQGQLSGTGTLPAFFITRQLGERVFLQDRTEADADRIPLADANNGLVNSRLRQTGGAVLVERTGDTVILADQDDTTGLSSGPGGVTTWLWDSDTAYDVTRVGVYAAAGAGMSNVRFRITEIFDVTNNTALWTNPNNNIITFAGAEAAYRYFDLGQSVTIPANVQIRFSAIFTTAVVYHAPGSYTTNPLSTALTATFETRIADQRDIAELPSSSGGGITAAQLQDEHYNRYRGTIGTTGADFDAFPSAVRNDIVQAVTSNPGTVNGLGLVGDARYRCIVDSTSGGDSSHWEQIASPAAPVDSGWVSLTLNGSWTNAPNWPAAAYRKIGDRVDVRAAIRASASLSAGTFNAITLPAVARPAGLTPFVWLSGSSAAVRHGVINASGDVAGVNLLGSNETNRFYVSYLV